MNIQQYMQNVGVEARKASRLMASADTNQKKYRTQRNCRCDIT